MSERHAPLPPALSVALVWLTQKLSEPLLFYFSSAELFQEIDSYAKQRSKEHNAERIWEWALQARVGRGSGADSERSSGAWWQASWEPMASPDA